jgi:hypothetical protein
MANEFKHKDPGTEITQAEYISSSGDGHIFACQATGDILYASSTTVLKNLGKGAANTVLNMGGSCIPAWTASPSVTDLTIGGGCITLSAATDIDLLDNTASALSFDATGKTGIIDIVTTNCSEGVTMSGTLGVTGVVTASAGIELGHASDTTIARSGSGAITVEGNQVYLAGGTDVPVSDGGTGASTLTANGILVGNGTSAVAVTATMATKGHLMVGDGSGVPSMLAVGGTCDHVLTVDSGEATGLKWAAAGGLITAINCFTANELVTVGGTTTELCGEANLFYDATTLTLQKNSGRPVLDLAGYANGPNASGLLRLRHSGNTTPGCHTAVAAGEQLGEIRFCGSNGSAFATGVTIYALSNQTWSGSAGGTRLEFRVTADCATSPVSRMTLENCGNLSLDNNDLLNVGASTNDWTDGGIFTAGVVDLNNGANSAIMTVETESTNNVAQIKIITGAGSTQVNDILFVQGSGNGAADNMGWNLGYLSAGPYFRLRSNDNNGSSGDGCIWRVHDGGEEMLLAANHGSNFDKYDDALVLERHFSDPYRVGETLIKESQNELIEMGVLVEGSDGWIGQSINRWVPLLAGGIYQTRFTLDKNHECHEARLKALEARLNG